MTLKTDTSTQALLSKRRGLYIRLPFVVAVAVLVLLSPRSATAGDFHSLQWANDAIQLQQVWQLVPGRGAGITVCDADTGVMVNHPDLKNAIIGGLDTANAGAPASYGDDDGHGTFTAGIIVARGKDIWGIAPGASLLVAKVFNQGNADPMTVTAGILWCIDQGAQVVNLPLGAPAPSWDGFKEAIAFGCKQGVDFAVAAGNDRTALQPVDPASIASPCLIAVNASDRYDHLALFSNQPENKRTVTAPGQVIVSDWTNGSVALGSGTSASAAFVSGVMALLRSQGADAPTAVKVILASARHPRHELFVHHRSLTLGYGILDAGAACQMYREMNEGALNGSHRFARPQP